MTIKEDFCEHDIKFNTMSHICDLSWCENDKPVSNRNCKLRVIS